MATITTTATPSADLQTWDIQTPSDYSVAPRGEVVFAGSIEIPAKLTSNVSTFNLDMVLPPNFDYRFASGHVNVRADLESTTDNFSPVMEFNFPDGTTDGLSIPWWCTTLVQIQNAGYVVAQARQTGVADALWAWWENTGTAPNNWLTGNTVQGTWIDSSALATPAVQYYYNFRFLQFTVAQRWKSGVHTPIPTYGS